METAHDVGGVLPSSDWQCENWSQSDTALLSGRANMSWYSRSLLVLLSREIKTEAPHYLIGGSSQSDLVQAQIQVSFLITS